MAPIPAREFASLLADLSGAELAGFVADLWRERGYAVRDGDGPGVLVVRRGDETRRLYVDPNPGALGRRAIDHPSGVDAVVTARLDSSVADTTVIDARELRDVALYAVDREACSRLFSAYFDRPPTVDREPRGGRARRLSPGADRRAHAVTAVAAFVLLVGAIGGSAAGSLQLGDPVPTPAETATFTPEPASTPSPGDVAGIDRPPDAGFPPGLGPDGIEDAGALASAHAARVSGRSYRLVLTYYERHPGTVAAAAREVVTVAGPRVYVSERWSYGPPEANPPIVADAAVYADGTTRFERRRVDNATRYRAEPASIRGGGEGPFADRVETYLRWYLSVERSVVADRFERDGRTFYRVYGFGDPWPGVSNATTSALIDSSGVVHELRRTHDVPGTDREVVVTIRYSAVGEATVDPPPWYPAARNATATPATAGDPIHPTLSPPGR